ncbi:hypothetical protein [Streptomyces sp. NPDC001502]|uniref:hypothetical protein n=1 Tax=Streptomyces sp. NPDC001502 TaxID=3364578 RepID=UPI00367EF738
MVAPLVELVAATLTADDDEDAAAHLVGMGELLDALAQTSPASKRSELNQAARAFERATCSHIRAERSANRAMRSAARGILRAGVALGRGEDAGATAMLLSTLILAAVAAVLWHAARGHAQQAAARQAAWNLRAACRSSAAFPLSVMRE